MAWERRPETNGGGVRPAILARKDVGRNDHVLFRIDNYPQIEAAYGGEVAQRAAAHVAKALAEVLGDAGRVTLGAGGWLAALLWDAFPLGAPFTGADEHFLQWVCAAMLSLPMEYGGEHVHIGLSANCLPVETESETKVWPGDVATMSAGSRLAPVHGEPMTEMRGWAERYRADMAVAAGFFALMAGERLMLTWQTVRNEQDSNLILYHECLLRGLGIDGDGDLRDDLRPVLERLGFVHLLDRHIMSQVVNELEASSRAILGVRISAQSATLDNLWKEIETRLGMRRDIAVRLVIEIAPTASTRPPADIQHFVSRMRHLGCRIAFAGFGTDCMPVRRSMALAPDIIKVDGFFVRRAAEAKHGDAMLRHIVGLASAIARNVVLEGVETPEQSRRALAAGAIWQQGAHLGRASVIRPWVSERGGVDPGMAAMRPIPVRFCTLSGRSMTRPV